MWNRPQFLVFLVVYTGGYLYGQGGAVGCGDVVVDQFPFEYVGTTAGAGDAVDVSAAGNGNGEDFLFTLNVSNSITVDISLCHEETEYNAQMGLFLLNTDCTLDTTAPSSCAYPNSSQAGGGQVDCFAQDAPACTWGLAPTGGNLSIYTASYRPQIYEYDLSPIGAGTTTYYIVVDGEQGSTGNFKLTIENSEPPRIDSTNLSEHNQYLKIYFNEPIYRNNQPWVDPDPFDFEVNPVNQNDFSLTFIQNDGQGDNADDTLTLGWAHSTVSDPIFGWNNLLGGEQLVEFYLNLTGGFAGVETIEITPADGNSVFDGGGRAMDASITTGIITLNPDSIRWMNFDKMEPNNTYATFVFSQGVYTNPDVSGGLDTSDLNLFFQYNAGLDSATGLIMDSVKNTSGEQLLGGEDSIRVYVTPVGIPNGHEGWNVYPQNDTAIFENTGVGMWNGWWNGSQLIDKQSPYIVSAEITDSNSVYIITSERLDYGVDGDDFSITLNQNGGNAAGLSIGSIEHFNQGYNWYDNDTVNIHLDFTALPAGGETVELNPVADSVLDRRAYVQTGDWQYANPMDTAQTTGALVLYDKLPPEIDSMTTYMPTSNAYVALSITEGIFGDTAGTVPLETDDFEISNFNANGGAASAMAVASVSGPDGTALVGGEDSVWVYLDVTGSPSGVETFSITAAVNQIFDDNENVMADTMTSGLDTLNRYPSFVIEEVVLDSSNKFVMLILNEGVYGHADTSLHIPIEVEDLQMVFTQNVTGNVTNAVMDSLKKADSTSALQSGEDTLVVYFTLTNPPASGAETIEIRAADANSVFNTIGNAMTTSESTGLIFLNDLLSPSFSSANLALDTTAAITATEPLYANDNETGALDTSDFQLTFLSNGGNATSAAKVLVTKSDGSALNGGESELLLHFTPDLIPSGVEQIEINPVNAASIYDSVGNAMAASQTSGLLTLRDRLPPEIDSALTKLATSNAYAALSISEGLYSDGSGAETLSLSDFAVDFAKNGGTADTVILLQITRPDTISLSGGEDSLWVWLDVTGSPDSVETITIRSAVDSAIFDPNGNTLPLTSTSGVLTLNPYPRIDSSSTSLSSENEFVKLVLSEGVWGENSAPLDTSDLSISLNQNEGHATGAQMVALTKTNGSALFGGEDTILVYLSLSNSPAGGVETIEIKGADANSVFNGIGNPLKISESTGTIQLNDKLVPTFVSAELSLDTAVTVTLTEGLYTNADGTGPCGVLDFGIDFEQNEGNATTVEITAVSKPDGSDLGGGETVIMVHFTVTPLPSGIEEIEVRPATDASVYDAAGNAMPSYLTSGEVQLNDLLPPNINSSSNLTSDNQIEVRTSEGVYGTNAGAGALAASDFDVEFTSNGGNAASASIGSLTSEWNTNLTGGETKIRLHLDFDDLPSGVETIKAFPADSNSVFDDAGNPMENIEETPLFTLNDQLPPSITDINLEDQDTLPLIKSYDIELSLSEPLKTFNMSITAIYSDSLKYVLDTTSTVLTITIIPPLASLDTIVLRLTNMRDSANVVHDSSFVYTYYTPALGDYNWDDKIDVEDLKALVYAWYGKDYDYELGPVTGTIPHFIPLPDGDFDLDDGMAFTQMWYWINQAGGLDRPDRIESGTPLEFEILPGKISVQPPENSITGQVFLAYDPINLDVNLPRDEPSNTMSLSAKDEGTGHVLFEYADFAGSDLPELVFDIQTLDRYESELKITYVFYGRDGDIISRGTKSQKVIPIPEVFALHPVYPNPFNPITTIRFDIPFESAFPTILQVFDITGRKVETLVDRQMEAGYHEIVWNGNAQSSGVYFAELVQGENRQVQKMILLK